MPVLRMGLTLLIGLFILVGSARTQPPEVKPRIDPYGDPLPEGAIARLGSVRFRHPGAVHAVAFSQDGKILAASSDDKNMVIIWDHTNGRKIREIPMANKGLPPNRLQFSPNGKQLYSSYWGVGGTTQHVWDVETGAEVKDLPRPIAEASVLSFLRDGREAILREGSEIVRWDAEKRRELGRYAKPAGTFSTATLLGDQVLVPVFDGKAVHMWDVARKKQLWSIDAFRLKDYPGLPMTFSQDGKLFAVEAPPRKISVYNSATGKLVRRIETDVGKIYWSLSISPDSKTIAGSSWDGTVRLLDLESGRERVKISMTQGWVTHVHFSPDSKTFATGDGNNAHGVLLWDTATGKRIELFPGHTSPVSSVAFSPDGRIVATSALLRGDPVMRLWDPQSGRLLRSFEASDGGGIAAVAFSPDGKTLAASGWSKNKSILRLWDVGSGDERHALAGHEGGCTCLAFAPDSKRLASGDVYYNRMGQCECNLCIWDAERGSLIRQIRGTRGVIHRVQFTRDGRRLLAAADGVYVYDAETGKLIGEPLQADTRIEGMSLSADDRLVATSDALNQVRLWELAARREISLTVAGGNGRDVAFAPDGRTLAFIGLNGDVGLLDWLSEEIVGRLKGETEVGSRVVFSADGRRLATAGAPDSCVLIWNVADKVNRPLPAVAESTEAALQSWWIDLRDGTSSTATRAVWRFVAVPEQALPFLADALRPVKAPDPATVSGLIDDLGKDEFQVRERASRELGRLGDAVEESLRKAKAGDISLEQLRRINRLLSRLSGPQSDQERLRATRAISVLEEIGTPEARKLLAGLAAGAEGAHVTEEAKSALKRLEKRAVK